MLKFIKILGRKLCELSLEDVAYLEDAQLIFLIFHTFVCKIGNVWTRFAGKTYTQTNVWKIKKLTERLPAKLHPPK